MESEDPVEELPVVIVYPGAWKGALHEHPRAWHLITDEPGEALRRFAARRGSLRVMFAGLSG